MYSYQGGFNNSGLKQLCCTNVHKNVTKASITSCISNNEITLSGNQYNASVGCENTTVPSAGSDTLTQEALSKNLCHNKAKCEKIPDYDKNENKSALLVDINHSSDTDKWLNVNVPKRVQALLDGDKVTNCVLVFWGREQSEFDFGFIPPFEFKTPSNRNTNNSPLSPLEAHSRIKNTGPKLHPM